MNLSINLLECFCAKGKFIENDLVTVLLKCICFFVFLFSSEKNVQVLIFVQKGKFSKGDLGPVLLKCICVFVFLFSSGKYLQVLIFAQKGKFSKGDLGPVLLVCVCPLRRQPGDLFFWQKPSRRYSCQHINRISQINLKKEEKFNNKNAEKSKKSPRNQFNRPASAR